MTDRPMSEAKCAVLKGALEQIVALYHNSSITNSAAQDLGFAMADEALKVLANVEAEEEAELKESQERLVRLRSLQRLILNV